MSKIEFITTGNEIMSGLTVDTNFSWTAEKLSKHGLPIKYHSSVSDDKDDITSTLKYASKRSEFIIFTGGLGPTEDDLTSESAATVFNVPLVFNKGSFNEIKKKMSERGREVLDIHKKQAMFPKGSVVISNAVGTSSGFKYVEGKSSFYFLPGVPREFKSMIDDFVLPDILSSLKSKIEVSERVIKTVGLGESEVATRLKDIALENVELSYRIYFPEIHLKLVSKDKSIETAKNNVDKYSEILMDKLGEYIFTTENEELEEVVSKLLVKSKLTIATAESCTGGLLASRLTDIPGSSEYFLRGVVSYSNKSKSDLLDVPEKLIDKYGAVSTEVVEAMAVGIKNISGTDIGIGISGIAGPGGGSKEKPVGTVYIGIAYKDETVCSKRYSFNGTRKDIKLISSEYALDMIRKKLANKI